MCETCQKRQKIVLFFSILIAIIVLLTFLTAEKKSVVSSGKPTVVVSTFSLYEAACAVAGNTLHIRSIVPLGSDAHMFSPNPTQVADISKAVLFIYNGAGFETWVEPLKNTLPKTMSVMDMSMHVTVFHNDPHYWLDIDNMIKITQTLDGQFSKLSPANTELFHKNAATYIVKLQKLKADYTTGLSECKNRTLVTNHDAFGYLAHANKLENISVIGLSSDEQPSARTISHIVKLVKEHKIKTIFFEELISDNIAQTIAKETGVKVQPLQPLENISEDELKSHQTYLTVMGDNLKKLREAMECR
ncbi:MAG: zinc ABC transporter substrate-binding protein [Sulfuricurvum sp.]|nr:zinc ABC transporter substrate-binding protein [Sulfuricurvum sp.]MDD5386792.1 zinc ABC transporter substrate-binding protein [Sulfuricurvum sp.]